MQSFTRIALACALVGSLSGCASIIGSSTQSIPISSQPDGAAITITDETGTKVFAGTTPTNVTLKKSSGYFGGKTYNVVISKAGFQPTEVKLSASPNGWYIAGNLIFGGLIGWLVVDPLTGSMYTLSPDNISAALGAQPTAANQGVSVVLLGDVPTALRESMQRID